MTIKKEINLCEFKFWGGAKQVAELVKDTEWDIIEGMVCDYFNGEPITECELNDLFWFDSDIIADMLGYTDYETMFEERG